jgi:hypothetical protein
MTTTLTPSEKQRRYRNRLQKQGLRTVEIWVPDTRAANFVAQCKKQSAIIAAQRSEKETLAFIDDIAD